MSRWVSPILSWVYTSSVYETVKGRCRNFEEGGYWPSYGRSMRSLRQSDVPVISSSLEREKYFFRQNNLTLLEGLSFFIIRREKCPHLLIHLSNLKQALHQLVIIIHISLTNRCNSSCVLYVFFPVCELHFMSSSIRGEIVVCVACLDFSCCVSTRALLE